MDTSPAAGSRTFLREIKAPSRAVPAIQHHAGLTAPLSYSQQRLWFVCQSRAASIAYNVPWAWRIRGPLDLLALTDAFTQLIGRQASLRTSFHFSGQEPVQVVAPHVEFRLNHHDVSSLPCASREVATTEFLEAQARVPFDLSRAPLLRAHVVRFSAEEHVLFINVHHIVADGSSMGLIAEELSRLYAAADNFACLPELPAQYLDYSLWHRSMLDAPRVENDLAEWTERLQDLPLLELPMDRPRSAPRSWQGHTLRWKFERELSSGVRELGRSHGTTLFMTIATGMAALLSRYSGQEDVLLGFLNASRNRAEIRDVVGYFVNTQVLRADCHADPSFIELLYRVRQALLWAYSRSDIPFERLVQSLHLKRTAEYNPVFQALVAEQKVAWKSLSLAGLDVVPERVCNGTSKFDLSLYHEDGQEITGWLECNADIFDHATGQRVVDHFAALMRAALQSPNLPISQLRLLSKEEERVLTVDWNHTEAEYPREATIQSLFEKKAIECPGSIALVSNGKEITLQELNANANQITRNLQRLGVRPGQLVGICLPRSATMIAALLGLLKAGAAYVPLDPNYPPERLRFIGQDSRVSLIVASAESAARLPALPIQILCVDALVPEQNSTIVPTDVTSRSPAYVLYTSGSTGKPRGVMGSHRGVINRLAWMWREFPFVSGERCAIKTSLNFVDSVSEIFGPLLAGVPALLIDDAAVKDPARLIDELRKGEVTRLVLVPSLLRALLDADDAITTRLCKLKYCISSGEALASELIERFYKRLPHVQLLNLYGSTEVAADVTCFRAQPGDMGLIGTPIANTRAYILDAHGNPVPIGVTGELYIGGEGLALGYQNDAILTAARFVPDPFSSDPHSRLYRTGDRARYRSDRNIEYRGRTDQQVKLCGHRVELGEVEAALNTHPGVEQCAVVLHHDRLTEPRMVAYVVPERSYGSKSSGGAGDDSGASEWQQVWDENYRKQNASAEASFNINGWNSSYTGLPIPEAEMREWVEGTVRRVQASNAKRVLEVGCGSGLLTLRLAPEAERYVGTDFSPVALENLSQEVARRNLPQVQLLRRMADDFTGFADGSFDVVILNSIVQYFESIDYLLRVLQGALRVLRPDGAIFIGDVRSLPLLKAFHTSVQLHRAAKQDTLTTLRERVAKRVTHEYELVIDPEFFRRFAATLPEAAIRIEWKEGSAHNEMTCFRYDVTLVLRARNHDPLRVKRLIYRDRSSLAELQAAAKDFDGDRIELNGVPNARVCQAVRAAALLDTSAEDALLADIKAQLKASVDQPVDPADLSKLAGESWKVSVEVGEADKMNAVLDRRRSDEIVASTASKKAVPANIDWHAFANNPRKALSMAALKAELRTHLQHILPDFMVPSAFLVQDALPLLPNGKVDRRSLPMPGTYRPQRSPSFLGPTTSLESTITDIWLQALQIERLGMHDNFFDLGGHSLLLVRVHRELSKHVAQAISVTDMFRYPTVASLAGFLSRESQTEPGGNIAAERVRKRAAAMRRRPVIASGETA